MSASGSLRATRDRGALSVHPSVRASLPASAQARLGRAGLAGLLVSGLILTLAATRTDALLPETVRPIPQWLAGPLGHLSFRLPTIPLLAVLAAMFVSYVLAARHAERLSARSVIAVIAGLHALVLLAPPLLSTDVFSYQAYARMGASYGASPYLHGPSAIGLDPIYPFIGAKWVTMPTAYGPLFTLLSYVLAPLSIAAGVLAYKSIAALCSLALVALVWHAARLRGLDSRRAVALVALNPLIVLYGVGGAHNDLLMLALVTGGLYLLLTQHERSSGAAVVLAAGIKLTAILYGAFALAGSRGPNTRERRGKLALGAGATLILSVAVSAAAFGSGPLHMLATVTKGQSEGDWHSIAGFVTTKLGLPGVGRAVAIALAAAFLGITGWLLRRVWQGRLDWIDGAGWATAALLICASALFPWYVAWLLPFAALAADRRLGRVALVMTGAVQAIQMLGYIPHSAGLGA